MLRLPLACLVLTALGAQLPAQEPIAKSRVASVSLFKNGLAIVQRVVDIPAAGTYRLDTIPEAVHGTFWIESNVPVETALRLREVPAPEPTAERSLQETFGGRKVTVHFTNAKLPAVTGTALAAPATAAAAAAAPPADDAEELTRSARVVAAPERFFVVKTATGRMHIRPHEIAVIETDDAAEKAAPPHMTRKPVLTLTVAKSDKKPTMTISYLSHGLSWAPSYRVDITDPKRLTLEMATVLRNEMAPFADAEVTLISGFPSVEFAQVSSLLEAKSSWARFFQELNQRGSHRESSVLTQNIVTLNSIQPRLTPRLDLSATPAGEGVDLHYEAIGKRSLQKGEALSVNVGKSTADYERIVEWTLGRQPRGKEEMWDVLRFKNPFTFPLTTAPAVVVSGGKFNGQRTCNYTNAGEETSLKITRSLSVRAVHLEEQDSARPPERVVVGRGDYTNLHIKGKLVMNNHRKQPVKVHIQYALAGNLTSSEGSPQVVVREGTLTDINPTRDISWVVTLQPGEEKQLSFAYSTLTAR